MLSACVRSSGGKRELALNYGAGDGRMDCEDGRHLFMIGWMDVLVDRIARQFHLKRTSRVEKKTAHRRTEQHVHSTHILK